MTLILEKKESSTICPEVSNNNFGKPYIKLKGSTANFLKKKIKAKKYSIYLSLSDDIPWAQATVIISFSR